MKKLMFIAGAIVLLMCQSQARSLFHQDFNTDGLPGGWKIIENLNGFSIDLTYELNKSSNSFITCYDISNTASDGNVIDLAVNRAKAHKSGIDAWTVNPTGKKSARNAMGGVYTINQDASSGADFHSINEAVEALEERGIMDNVSFELANGTYEESIVLHEINGSTEDKRITFEGNSSNPELVALTSNPGYLQKPTIDIIGGDFYTFKNLTITINTTHFSNLVHINNGACNNHFENLRLVGAVLTNATYNNDKHLVYSHNDDYLDNGSKFEHCTFLNGYIGLYLTGGNYNGSREEGNQVIDCHFENQYSKSIYGTYQSHLIIKGNTFINNTDLKSGFQAMDFFRAYEDVTVEQNDIQIDFNNQNATGIEFRPGVGSTDEPIIIRNNMVRIHTNDSYSYTINVSDDETNNLIVAHNTCLIEGSSLGSACIFAEDEIISMQFKNNILQNNAGGYIMRLRSQALDAFDSDYNLCKMSGTKFARLGSDDYTSLADWASASNRDEHSRMESFSFVSQDDLHLAAGDNMTIAHPMSEVAYDFDDQTRSASTPCAGADEFGGTTDLPPEIANQVALVHFVDFPQDSAIDLSNAFNDPDNNNEDIILAVANNANTTDYAGEMNGKTLLVTRLTEEASSGSLTIRATSNGKFVDMAIGLSSDFAGDLPPEIANQVDPVHFVDFPQDSAIDLSNAFNDPDNNNEDIILAVANNANTTDYAGEMNGKTLLVTRLTEEASSGSLTIRATSNGKFVDMAIGLSSDFAGDLPPEIANQVDLVHFVDFPQDSTVDMSNAFNDPDNNNEDIILAVANNANPTDYAGEINGKILLVTRLTEEASSGSLTIRATSNGKFVDMAIGLSSDFAGDLPPEIANQVGPVHFVDSPQDSTIDLSNAFNDPDNNNEEIVLSIQSNSNEDDFSAQLNGKILLLNRLTEESAFGLITIRAESNGKYADMEIELVAEGEEDLPPVIANQVGPVHFVYFPQDSTVDMSNAFNDPDNNNDEIVLSIESNSNEDDFNVQISEKYLIINRLKEEAANAVIRVRATSNSLFVDMDIDLIGEEIQDLPPVIDNPVAPVHFSLFPEETDVDLSESFDDPDNNNDEIIISLEENTNEESFLAQINNKKLHIERLNANEAKGQIIIRATSNGQYVEMTIELSASIPVSVVELKNNISLFPNPAQDFIIIRGLENKDFTVSIYNLNGKKIIHTEGQANINIESLPRSQYILIIQWNEGRLSQKLIKQ